MAILRNYCSDCCASLPSIDDRGYCYECEGTVCHECADKHSCGPEIVFVDDQEAS